jgi:uncharacterized protein YwqG
MTTLTKVQEILKPYAQPVWVPRVQDRTTSPTESKYGGSPWLAEGESWPVCTLCHTEPLLFVLQLEISALPDPLKSHLGGQGWIQLFYSDHDCFPEIEKDKPLDLSTLSVVRRVRSTQGQAMPQPPDSFDRPPVIERAITGWQEMVEYPNWEERVNLKIPMGHDTPESKLLQIFKLDRGSEKAIMEQTEDGQKALAQIAEAIGYPGLTASEFAAWHLLAEPLKGDKLGGWEWWAQGPERFACPQCGKPMPLLYQLNAAEDFTDYWTHAYALPFFASDGTGHISYCPDHPDRLHFHWACG